MAWPTLTDALLTTEVRTLLGEPNARRVSDDEIVRWINMGVGTIAKMNLAIETTASFNLISGTYFYPVTGTGATGLSDCITVRAVIATGAATDATTPAATGKALFKMHPRHFSNIRASTAGAPQEYAWFANNLYVWPIPNVTTEMTVFYYGSIETIGTNDFAAYLPFHYQPCLIWFAYSQALMKIGKYEQALQYRSYFDNIITYHRQNDRLYTGVDSHDMMTLPDRTEFVG